LGFLLFLTIGATYVFAERDYFDIRGQLTTSHDDNVTFASTNEKSDVLQTILVGLDFKSEASRNKFLARVDIYQNFYFDNRSFDNTGVSLSLTDDFEVSERLRLNASDNFESAQAPGSFEDEFGRTNGRYRTDQNYLNLGADFDLNSHALLQATYGYDYTAYSREDLNDTQMQHTGGRFQYSIDEANRIGVGYDYSRRFFESGTALSGHTIYGDYGHSFTKQLSLKLKAGQDFINSDLNGSSKQARYEVTLANDINATTRGSLNYRRGLNSYATSQNLFDSYQVSAALGRELTPRLVAGGVAFYGEGEYQQTQIKDKLAGASVGLNYSFSENISSGINYSFSETDSNDTTRSYQRNVISFQTLMKF